MKKKTVKYKVPIFVREIFDENNKDEDGNPEQYFKCAIRFDKTAWANFKPFLVKAKDGRIYMNFYVQRMAEPDGLGNTHIGYVQKMVVDKGEDEGNDDMEKIEDNTEEVEEALINPTETNDTISTD